MRGLPVVAGLWALCAAPSVMAGSSPAVLDPAGPPVQRVYATAQAPPPKPFHMAFEVMHVFNEDGDLALRGQQANAVGLHFIFPEGPAVRQHLTLAHHWENKGDVSRRGFRLDLISVGFPIPIVSRMVKVSIEPVLRVLRGEILFASQGDGPSTGLVRVQSGFGLELNAEFARWFVAVEPLSIDFRYLELTKKENRSGFSRLWSFAFMVGRAF
jgi:hypothetical protein